MKVLLIGNGGREHAIARALIRTGAHSRVLAERGTPLELFAQAGNPGIDRIATPVDFGDVNPADPNDSDAIAQRARDLNADLVIVGPEAPLVAGLADAVRAQGIACFGPGKEAARLEASKSFAKTVMDEAGVATARSFTCHTMDEVDQALRTCTTPHVVKDDQLAAGKGVLVTADTDAAREHARHCLDRPDGAVVIEDYLDGPEVSLFCISDGTHVVPLVPAQDFKRLQDANEGPNTGGMGAYSPLPWLHDGLADEVVRTIAEPTVRRMAQRGIPFTGLLYCGLAMSSNGVRVVEFNVRFGDPETQVVLERLESPLLDLLDAAARGTLDQAAAPTWSDDAAVTVVLASPGYPVRARTGQTIRGAEAAEELPGVHLIHAGTKSVGAAQDSEAHATLVADGGRVLDVVARAATIDEARRAAYEAIGRIDFPECQFRRDIAQWPDGLSA